MKEEILLTGLKCTGIILLAIFAGNGAVWFFNKIPAQWLCDYGEKPNKELLDPYTQRVKSHPWKYIFTMLFIIMGIKLVMDDWQFAIAAMCSLWILLELSIADVKYKIVPDQLVILLAATALGFIPFQYDFFSCLLGGAVGLGITIIIGLIGKIFTKNFGIGGGDIKLYGALGLIVGVEGILFIFAVSTFICAAHVVILLVRKKINLKSGVAMVPYAAIATAIYLLFFWHEIQILYL